MILKRISIDLILLFLAFTLPWWWSIFFAFIMTFLFADYFEIIFYGLCIDMISASSVHYLGGFQFFFSLATLLLFLLSSSLRKKFFLYS